MTQAVENNPFAEDLTVVCSFCRQPLDGLPHEGETDFAIESYNPCPTCEANQAKGITIIEVAPEPISQFQPPINAAGTAYPTGKWWIIPEAEVRRVFADTPNALAKVLQQRGIFMTEGQARDFGLYDEDRMIQVEVPSHG